MRLGPVRVMGAGMVVMMCVEEVPSNTVCVRACVLIQLLISAYMTTCGDPWKMASY